MGQIFTKSFVVSILILTTFSCKKETHTTQIKSLILGKWIGINKINRTTSTNPSTNVISYFSDTLYEVNTGLNFYIEFKTDSLTSIGHYVSSGSSYNDVSIGNIRYNIYNDILSFPLNPFTLQGVFNNSSHFSSKIFELTTNKLVLYDVDTIQPNPLLIHETWCNFKK